MTMVTWTDEKVLQLWGDDTGQAQDATETFKSMKGSQRM